MTFKQFVEAAVAIAGKAGIQDKYLRVSVECNMFKTHHESVYSVHSETRSTFSRGPTPDSALKRFRIDIGLDADDSLDLESVGEIT